MADTFQTPNMNLDLPVPGARTGPQYASDINGAFIKVDSHDHSEQGGVKVTPAGLDMTSDLSFNGNNIVGARSLRLTDQLAALSGSNDLVSVYAKDGDLYFNNAAGTQVQVTSGGSLNTGAIVTNVWGVKQISASLTILGSDAFTDVRVNASSAITITLPAANAVAAGRYYVIHDAAGTSQSYPITLAPSSGATINGSASSATLSSQYSTWFVESDGVSKWSLTYTSIAALTSNALTYGSNVFSASGLTLPSGSILSVGSGSWNAATGALSATSVAAGTVSASGAITGSSLATTGNVTINGNLSVLGTTSIDASNLAISTITNGTITNPTITNGTMTGTAISGGSISGTNISGGSISGATLSGGNIGSAGGIATLNSSNKIPTANLSGYIVNAYYTEYTGTGITVTQGTGWNSLSSSSLQLSVPCIPGDILMIDANWTISQEQYGWVRAKIALSGTGRSQDSVPEVMTLQPASGSTRSISQTKMVSVTVNNTITVSLQVNVFSKDAIFYGYQVFSGTVICNGTTNLRIMHIRK